MASRRRASTAKHVVLEHHARSQYCYFFMFDLASGCQMYRLNVYLNMYIHTYILHYSYEVDGMGFKFYWVNRRKNVSSSNTTPTRTFLAYIRDPSISYSHTYFSRKTLRCKNTQTYRRFCSPHFGLPWKNIKAPRIETKYKKFNSSVSRQIDTR